MRIKSKLDKPSLEVAQTTLRLVLLIYSFQLRCAFSSRSRHWLLPISLTFSRKRKTFIPWPWNFDLWPWPTNMTHIYGQDEPPCRTAGSKSISFHCYHTNRHTSDRLQHLDHKLAGKINQVSRCQYEKRKDLSCFRNVCDEIRFKAHMNTAQTLPWLSHVRYCAVVRTLIFVPPMEVM